MVPAREDPADGARARGGHDRPLRPHHALARRDGARGRGDGARGLHAAAADRRRHHQQRAHRGQDRARLPRPGGARARRLARGGRGRAASRAPSSARASTQENRARAGARCARQYRAQGRGAAAPARWRRRAARRTPLDWATYEPPRPVVHGRARAATPVPLDEIVPFIDWSPFFHAWELRGTYPRIFENPAWGARGEELFDDAQAAARRASCASELLDGARRLRLLPGERRGRRHRAVRGRDARAACCATLRTLRQQSERPADQPLQALADFVAPRESGPGATTWAPSR